MQCARNYAADRVSHCNCSIPRGSLDLGSHQDPSDPTTHRTFVTHVDANLKPIWHYQVGGPTAGWPSERINKVAAGRDGSIYVGGEFSGTGEFWPSAAGRA